MGCGGGGGGGEAEAVGEFVRSLARSLDLSPRVVVPIELLRPPDSRVL